MKLQENVPLAPFTTLHVGGSARYLVEIDYIDDLEEALMFARSSSIRAVRVMGGGSNMIVSDQGFDGLILQLQIADCTCLPTRKESQIEHDVVTVTVGAGKSWDEFVAYCVSQGWWGIENLSSIPGTVGAAPVQNIGAYGQEVGDVIESVRVYDRTDGSVKTLMHDECAFTYRKSIFNSTHKGQYIVLEVTFRLSTIPKPNIEYIDVKNYFSEHHGDSPTLADIRTAIVNIRKKKFADPDQVGTAGSFFKNCYLTPNEYQTMHARVSEVCGTEKAELLEKVKNKFPTQGKIKIPTAFIIDTLCELKGTRTGGAQVSETQALAIINPEKQATAKDIMQLVKKVRQTVYDRTTIALELEPELVGFTQAELDEYLALD